LRADLAVGVMMTTELYFTIGHSTHSVANFIALLREARADVVADVRTVPRSAANPQFNKNAFATALADEGIGYRHLPLLGGLRSRQRNAIPSPNAFWRNDSFRNYADYAMTPAFSAGLQELRTLGRDHHPAIMCAEAVWWRCHRRIITDYLIAAGATVRHVLGHGNIEPAEMTNGAVKKPGGILVYAAS
jgi:uncharacterized protein (DUF488 family)